MQSSIRFTFKMVVYGAIILALTTFYAIDRVKAEQLTGPPNRLYCPTGSTFSNLLYEDRYYSGCIGTNVNKAVSYYNLDNGDYDISFYFLAPYNYNTTFSTISANSVGCFVNSVNLGSPTGGSSSGVATYQAICFNVPVRSGQVSLSIESKISGSGNNLRLGTGNGPIINKHFDNSSVINSITNQTNTIHQDNEETNKKIDETNKNIKDTNDLIKNDEIDNDNIGGTFNQLSSLLDVDTNVITQLFILPYNLISIIIQNNDVCTPINLGSLFGNDLTLPCLDIRSYLGDTLYHIIDVIFAGIISIGFLNSLKRMIDKITTLSSDIESETGIAVFK